MKVAERIFQIYMKEERSSGSNFKNFKEEEVAIQSVREFICFVTGLRNDVGGKKL
jgi:hypothetical protein